MKKLISKLTFLCMLAFCLQVLTASTGISTSDAKARPRQTKQTKAQKTNRNKAQMPLFKSLLNHF